MTYGVVLNQYKIPNNGIASGVQFGMFGDQARNWTVVDNSTFALSPEGDNMFLYCLDQYSEPHFIYGIIFGSSNWSRASDSNISFDVEQSALPETLTGVGNLELPGYGNWRYVGPSGLTVERMKAAFSNTSNWQGSDLRYTFSTSGSPARIGTTMTFCVSSFLLLLIV